MAKTKKKIVESRDEELDVEFQEESTIFLQTHESISEDLCGEIQKLEAGQVEIELVTTQDMVADDMGLIHGGFIFGSADYAAMVAVNERNVVLVASECEFLAPVKLGDVVNITAKVRQKEGRKRNVEVEAHVLDIKVFAGLFKTVITERHVLKLNLLETAGENKE